ncbi:MAG TPA: [Fe-Fe] hydrogenase large subunit C-terminal domain-containing protein [Thermoleophilia bacterium]|nr:[Fe-Fe] hydrogenase large subunit C-terminal domain-containing protein [Thermoleophilia bacterium]
MPTWDNPLITIIGEKCRMCYACVRECPAKAIRVVDGQASVIQPRCIGCGNCLRVCTQNAKEVRDDTERAFSLLQSREPVAAMLAPSFAAEFTDLPLARLVGMIRALGFTSVHEVAFGADLVAQEYRRLIEDDPNRRLIATACPAVTSYVRKHEPQLMAYLAPVVSPMIAMARVLRHDLGQDLKVVFIGPCVAKKEASTDNILNEIDTVLTFAELREMFDRRGMDPEGFSGEDRFDPPYGGIGAVFPIAGGLLQTAGLQQDLLSGEMIVAEGRDEFIETINEFDLTHADARLLDVLSCQGCYAGPGMTSKETMLQRRTRVSNYARNRLNDFTEEQLAKITNAPERYKDLSLYRAYVVDYQPVAESATTEDIRKILDHMGKHREEDLLNCGACGYATCLDHARAVYEGLADSDMCLPHTIEQLRAAYEDLEVSHRSLGEAQDALERSTKLASMGQLAAGIAHEVNNPLSTLLLHANLLLEECEQESETHDDLETIVDQANRCKRIISGLLNFARQSRVIHQPTNLAQLVEKVLHTTGFNGNVEVQVEDELKDPVAEIDGDQIVQVLANLITNAQHAMPDGGRIVITLQDTPDEVRVMVSDTGEGVPKENMDKIFDPFFTTKQVGVGTGLGLAVTHGIVKMHRGQIIVESNADPSAGPTGTTFIMTLPRYEEEAAR